VDAEDERIQGGEQSHVNAKAVGRRAGG
jgi:hypothetical protein